LNFRTSPPSHNFNATGLPHRAAAIHLATVIPDDCGLEVRTQETTSFAAETANTAFAFKKNTDPDSLMYHEAMADADRKLWLQGMDSEIKQLEKMDCWDVIPRSKATKRVAPSTWAYRRKRFPDGRVRKRRSRFCVRGDLKDEMNPWEMYAPVVSASTVRLVLIMSLVFGLTMWCMDFTNAFVHAQLPKEDYYFIELPKGYATKVGSVCVLCLKRALYGSRGSPKGFFTVLKDSYLRRGFVQSKLEPCLFFKGMMIL
jgi:hypothetical protein